MNNRQRKARPAGFTLIELLVAIGAVAVIAVGIAAIFASVGRTVAGGRRVGNLNQYAALIERQMRADFEAMTRDGVLVIRHQFADVDGDGVIDLNDIAKPDAVPLYADDKPADRRNRRIDQILFMASGEFTSSRTPLIPGTNAQASTAIIHYGQGTRLDPIEDYDGSPVEYELPQVDDGTLHPVGGSSPNRPFRPELALGYDDPTNPNRYASEWTLLRRLTLLATPAGSEQELPDTQVLQDLGFSNTAPLLDSDVQVGGQPALTSPFRSLAAVFPTGGAPYLFPPDFIRGYGARNDGVRYPAPASGIVDAATSDLAEIRRFISDIGEYPWNIADEAQLFDPANPAATLLDDEVNATNDLTNLANDLHRIHAWMDDLFPTPAYVGPTVYGGVRTRYEHGFPDLVGLLGTEYPDGTVAPFTQSYRLADQRALSASVFVPRCSEFIVEYSFGQVVVNPTSPYNGQLIWFGAERRRENDTGMVYPGVERYPYDTTDSGNRVRPFSFEYKNLDGTTATHTLEPALVYGRRGGAPGPEPTVLTAYFGYNDPTYQPSGSNDPETLPWPWPKLIRVTMTLADPVDPSIEQTFQFIFETPDAR